MMMSEREDGRRPWPCRLDGRKLIPCWALDECLEDDGRGSRQQGLKLHYMTDMKSHKFSRTLASVKSGKHRKNGLFINYCPFCGAPTRDDIDERTLATRSTPPENVEDGRDG